MKWTKFEAKYTPHAKEPDERCGLCKHFLKPDGCELVQGDIRAQGWCKFFSRKK